ncbi:glycosyltransferase family A protein [Virgibacillus sp. YIM 98842]|uniref:glycosyltransferase family 2 protein n=1 Tax=Virgibacillus sp. YIM 98842 TaxID=2663533 RepID=UPI0013DD60EC|nr:glycosyltransferase family A protein [Virgibacillus sp. YIM 98842]
MKDITAVLVHYSDKKLLDRALQSLKNVGERLESVIILQKPSLPLRILGEYAWIEQMECIYVENQDAGETLNKKINLIRSDYLLLLHDTDYLSPGIKADSLYLPHSKKVLVTSCCSLNQAGLPHPLLVRTSYLQQHQLLPDTQIPFKEALFPAWLSTVDNSFKSFSQGMISSVRKNSTTNKVKREEIIKKYNFVKPDTEAPALSVIIANYNMEKYVNNAISSCLLQSVQPEQLLIMDDGSTDHSFRQLKHWNDREPVRVFHKKNGGKARALNDLLPHVSSEFILELDADDWLDPDAVSVIKKQLKYLPKDISVLYGNLRKWKQYEGEVLFKGVAKGKAVNGRKDLLSYRFPLGPRIYRTASLKEIGGFPVIAFEDGRLYEDVSVLNQLIKTFGFKYEDFTVYNVREHKESITRNHLSSWNGFLKTLQ